MSPSAATAYEDLIQVDTYDSLFREYSKRYFGPDFDWRIFKAQAIVESRLDPNVVSKEGAVGLMQILPATYRQIAAENPDIQGDIRDPRWNIAAGIYYNRRLWELWDAGRPFEERLRFMLGAYNAGKKSILKAQQVAIERKLNPYTWPSIEQTLESVIGPEYRQTLYYVEKVFQIRSRMDGMKEASLGKIAVGHWALAIGNSNKVPPVAGADIRHGASYVKLRPSFIAIFAVIGAARL